MKKLTAYILPILSLIPLSQHLLIKTSFVLSSYAVMISSPEKVNAESYDFYLKLANEKAEEKEWYKVIFYLSKAIEMRPYGAYAYWGRGLAKGVVGNLKGACADFKKAEFLGEDAIREEVKELLENNC